MCAFYGLIAIEVTNVHRNCACACVRVHACGLTCASRPTRRTQYIIGLLMHNIISAIPPRLIKIKFESCINYIITTVDL